MKATVCKTLEEYEASGPGAIFIPGGHYIMQKCVGCGQHGGMRVFNPGEVKPASPSWEISGVPDNITLKPSIHHTDCWHGFLTNGIYST